MTDVLPFRPKDWMPDFFADVDRDHPASGLYGIRKVHHALLRHWAGQMAIEASHTDLPFAQAVYKTQEKLFDELANILEQIEPLVIK